MASGTKPFAIMELWLPAGWNWLCRGTELGLAAVLLACNFGGEEGA